MSEVWYCSQHLPPVSTTPAIKVAKFASGVVDTGGNFATTVVDTGSKFASGVNLKKTWSKKSRDTVPLTYLIFPAAEFVDAND